MQPANGYRLRRGTPADFATLNDIEQAAAQRFPPGSLPAEVREDKLPFSVLEQACQRDMLWLIEDVSAVPVGYVMLEQHAGLTLLAQIDVHPAHGRQGLGTTLVKHALSQLAQNHIRDVWLTTFSSVPWNAPFYQKLGFCPVDEKAAPQAIRDILHQERARGLQQRVAMRLRQ